MEDVAYACGAACCTGLDNKLRAKRLRSAATDATTRVFLITQSMLVRQCFACAEAVGYRPQPLCYQACISHRAETKSQIDVVSNEVEIHIARLQINDQIRMLCGGREEFWADGRPCGKWLRSEADYGSRAA